VELVRRSVRLVDARNTVRGEAIGHLLAEARVPASPWATPQQFPYEEPQAELLPAEETGFALRERTVRESWLRLLWHVLTFGRRSATAHSSDQCELLDVTTVIGDEPGDPAQFSLAPWMPLQREQLGGVTPEGSYTGYLAQLIEPGHAAAGVSYTYGDRLRRGAGEIDQLEALIGELRARGESRRAVASLWEPARDATSSNPPCLTLLQARLRAGRLHLSAYFRSHDIFRAWLMNAYGLRALQAHIAGALAEPAELGDLAIISHSAHVYAHDWDAARELLAHHYRPADPRLVRDPRGSFVIALEPDAIVVRHYSPEGQHLRTLRGASAHALGPQLTPFVSNQNHAIYLGQELQKAEFAMRLGCPEAYRQDRELQLPGR
jgi:thymidylate synthase